MQDEELPVHTQFLMDILSQKGLENMSPMEIMVLREAMASVALSHDPNMPHTIVIDEDEDEDDADS